MSIPVAFWEGCANLYSHCHCLQVHVLLCSHSRQGLLKMSDSAGKKTVLIIAEKAGTLLDGSEFRVCLCFRGL